MKVMSLVLSSFFSANLIFSLSSRNDKHQVRREWQWSASHLLLTLAFLTYLHCDAEILDDQSTATLAQITRSWPLKSAVFFDNRNAVLWAGHHQTLTKIWNQNRRYRNIKTVVVAFPGIPIFALVLLPRYKFSLICPKLVSVCFYYYE